MKASSPRRFRSVRRKRQDSICFSVKDRCEASRPEPRVLRQISRRGWLAVSVFLAFQTVLWGSWLWFWQRQGQATGTPGVQTPEELGSLVVLVLAQLLAGSVAVNLARLPRVLAAPMLTLASAVFLNMAGAGMRVYFGFERPLWWRLTDVVILLSAIWLIWVSRQTALNRTHTERTDRA